MTSDDCTIFAIKVDATVETLHKQNVHADHRGNHGALLVGRESGHDVVIDSSARKALMITNNGGRVTVHYRRTQGWDLIDGVLHQQV